MADKVVTLYRRLTADGFPFRQIAGLDLPASAAGSFGLPQAIVGPELVKPEAGDTIRDDEGGEWVVATVGELADGSWPVTCSGEA